MALKTFKPTSPSRRNLVQVDRSELYKGRPEKSLTKGLTKSGGRNNTGRITMRPKVVVISVFTAWSTLNGPSKVKRLFCV